MKWDVTIQSKGKADETVVFKVTASNPTEARMKAMSLAKTMGMHDPMVIAVNGYVDASDEPDHQHKSPPEPPVVVDGASR